VIRMGTNRRKKAEKSAVFKSSAICAINSAGEAERSFDNKSL